MSEHQPKYDAKQYWNEKALRAGGDPLRAVCLDDPTKNWCIERVQRSLVHAGLRRIPALRAPAGLRVLDYGCGSGRWAPYFVERGCSYLGVDIAPAMVDLARSHHPDAEFQVLRDGAVPAADGEFDLVVSIAAIHHNPPDQQEGILDEVMRVLAPSGTLFLFESVGEPDPNNVWEYARPKVAWDSALENRGLSRRWYRGGRYLILGKLLSRVIGSTGGMLPERPGRWPRWVVAMDALLDPLLGRLLPERYQERGAMIFARTHGGGSGTP